MTKIMSNQNHPNYSTVLNGQNGKGLAQIILGQGETLSRTVLEVA